MTKEEKINWLRNATNEEVLGQYRRAIAETNNFELSFKVRLEAEEDERLAKEEILRRMTK